MPAHDGFRVGEGPANEEGLFGFAIPQAEGSAGYPGVEANPPAVAAGEVDEGAVVHGLSKMDVPGGNDGIERGGCVENPDMDVAVEGGEDEARSRDDDAGDGAGEGT